MQYPANWQVLHDSDAGIVTLTGDGLELALYSPELLADAQLDNYNPVTLTLLAGGAQRCSAGRGADP